ncbi:MAG: hypothetical protein ACO3IB_03460 [Phycisphaerales bacterium]
MSPRNLGCFAVVAALALAPSTLHAQVVPGATGPDPARQGFFDSNPGTGVFELDGRITRVFGQAFSQGSNPVESAEGFLRNHLGMLSADFSQLMAIGPNGDGTHVVPVSYDHAREDYKFFLVGYTQHVKGIPVFRGDVRCLVRNDAGFPLVLVSNALRDVREFAATFTGKAISPSQLDLRKVSRAPLNQFGPGAKISDQEQVIWAGYDGAPAAQPRLAVKFIVTGTGVFDRSAYQRMLYVVDSETGKILFQEDQILHADVTVTVNGQATQGIAADACGPEAVTLLPYARITYGATTLYTGVDGTLTIPNITTSTTFTSTMAGRWFSVNDVANGSVGSIALASAGGALTFTHNPANNTEDYRAEVNAYLQANIVRDLLMLHQPSFPTIATQTGFPINVQVAGTCNAYYDGSSINFYPAGGGCNNTAFAPVVHHEYGHHIVNRAGSGQGAYGEGFGDVMGVLVTDDPRLAVGFQTCTSGIRNADNTCTYNASSCSSCGSAIHSCGQLLSGCVWDVRNNLLATNPSTYRSIVSELATGSVLLHTGTTIAGDITIDFLTLDDDNGNINDGTPHYAEINNAFTEHGLPGPAIQLIGFSFPSGQPSTSAPNGTTTFPVNVTALAGTPQPGTGKLFYRFGTSGTFNQVNMAQGASNQYTATLPAGACGSTLQYYVAANTTTAATGTSPSNAPLTVYTAIVADSLQNKFVDTVETNLGWSLSAPGDTATTGLWTRADPLGTSNAGVPVQPENDVTVAGTICFFTGQGTAGGALGEADVDGGFTTLTSPTMDATGGEAYVSYNRWYSNQQGGAPNADTFRVQISNNNGASWLALETVGPTGAEVNGGWFFKEFRIADFLAPTNQMKLRFIADDAGTGSLIEAAVDEVKVRVVVCNPSNPADLNNDGVVNGQDLAILLGAWGSSGPGDIDGNGNVDGADLAQLLGSWTI